MIGDKSEICWEGEGKGKGKGKGRGRGEFGSKLCVELIVLRTEDSTWNRL